MRHTLEERLRAIADSVDDWNAPITAKQDCEDAIAEIERLRGERPTCKWSRDGEVYDTGCGECFAFTDSGESRDGEVYDTGCGECFAFTDSGDLAEQPSIQWCPFCSGLIREAAEAAGGET